MSRVEVLQLSQCRQQRVLHEINRVLHSPGGQRQSAARPAAQRRQASDEQRLERFVVSATNPLEQIEGDFRFERGKAAASRGVRVSDWARCGPRQPKNDLGAPGIDIPSTQTLSTLSFEERIVSYGINVSQGRFEQP